ncbi:hypothetical protein [Brevibacillus sp. BD139]|uniref:hypothetical protein n=1 Tax=Brevibacillus sp. BD139 TaxID=2977190 RepID=UPI0035620553
MVSVVIKREICLLFFHKKKSQRAIARELRVHRNTVKMCVEEMNEALTSREILKEEVTNWRELILVLVQPSVYPVEHRKKQKVTNEIIEMIRNRWEKQDKKNRMQIFLDMKREFGTSIDVNGEYQSSSFSIGYSTFCEIVKKFD